VIERPAFGKRLDSNNDEGHVEDERCGIRRKSSPFAALAMSRF
jgi:hypothetical protein